MAHVTGNFTRAACGEGKRTFTSPDNSDSPVRIVLFRECRFKECQLLFDSHCSNVIEIQKKHEPDNTHCSLYPHSKVNEEFHYLTEMIFGTTPMRYHGTYFKIHDITSPERVVFTQVFSSPSKADVKQSATALSSLKNLSDLEESLESLSIFRKTTSSIDSSSTVLDSGFSEESLVTSQFTSFNTDISSFSSISGTSCQSLRNSYAKKSNLECYSKPGANYSKLGVAVIIAIARNNTKCQRLYTNYISFIHSVLCRLKRCIEYTICSPKYLFTRLLEISNDSTRWLSELTRDIRNDGTSSNVDENYGKSNVIFNFGKVIKNKLLNWNSKSNCSDVNFGKFCQLIQMFDVKETNYFLSTLLTLILTHHPSWVWTCYRSPYEEISPISICPYNALWSQLRYSHGLIGLTTKISRIVISGRSQTNFVKDVLNFVKCFIRNVKVERREIEFDDGEENSHSKMFKTRTFCSNLAELSSIEEIEEEERVQDENDPVIFILGDDEELVNLKKSHSNPTKTAPKSTVKVVNFPLPKFKIREEFSEVRDFLKTDFERFVPDLPVQGTILPESCWIDVLNKELSSGNGSCCFSGNENVDEVITIVGDTKQRKVKLMSSNKRSVYKNNSAKESHDTSPMIVDMLEITQKMFQAGIPKEYCVTHLEQRLTEICLKSNTLAEMLLNNDICTMNEIISSLKVTVNDVPLLMSVVMTICPELTRKYGLSYQ